MSTMEKSIRTQPFFSCTFKFLFKFFDMFLCITLWKLTPRLVFKFTAETFASQHKASKSANRGRCLKLFLLRKIFKARRGSVALPRSAQHILGPLGVQHCPRRGFALHSPNKR